MPELAHFKGLIAAPAKLIWEILTDFEHPQRLAKSIEGCQANGSGLGSVRVVTARGVSIHERLDALDPASFRLSYRALRSGQMPAVDIKTYLATVVLTPLEHSLTEIEWWSEGDIDGPPATVRKYLTDLYRGAVENIRAELETPPDC